MLNPKYESKYFQNQENVPSWWTEEDDKDVEDALNAPVLKPTADTDPSDMDESILDESGDEFYG